MVCIAWYEAAGTLPPPLPTTVNSVPPDCMVPRTSGGLQLSWVLVLTSWPPTSWLLLAKGAGEISGNFLSCSKGVKDPLEVPRLGVISLETPLRKWDPGLLSLY